MPPTDASADADAGPAPQPEGTAEDTLDLQLPDELATLFDQATAGRRGPGGLGDWDSPGPGDSGAPGPVGSGAPGEPYGVPGPGDPDTPGAPGAPGTGRSGGVAPAQSGSASGLPVPPGAPAVPVPDGGPARYGPAAVTGQVTTPPAAASPPGPPDRSVDVAQRPPTTGRMPGPGWAARPGSAPHSGPGCVGSASHRPAPGGAPSGDDLLDTPGGWAPATTPLGPFDLVPVRLERDLPLLTQWMNDPAVAAFWELAGPDSVTAAHLRGQLEGDGRSVPCLGVLGATPMSYWEIYRADLDPLARHYPARPHDTGIHLLVGGVADRGRRVGTTLLRAVADLILDNRPHCTRVIAEPDLRNTPSIAAFLSAGFRFHAEVDLPDKRAALMVRDRALRNLL